MMEYVTRANSYLGYVFKMLCLYRGGLAASVVWVSEAEKGHFCCPASIPTC